MDFLGVGSRKVRGSISYSDEVLTLQGHGHYILMAHPTASYTDQFALSHLLLAAVVHLGLPPVQETLVNQDSWEHRHQENNW